MTHTAAWKRRIASAQDFTHDTISGQQFARVPYGDEVEGSGPTCRDCGVQRGQLHVPSCCIERCPRCGHQAYGCDCFTAGEEAVQ